MATRIRPLNGVMSLELTAMVRICSRTAIGVVETFSSDDVSLILGDI
jgi:hypothetical protein